MIGNLKRWATALVASALGMLATEASAAELGLRRVLLTTGGVGYFEHEARVEGTADLTLDVRLDQVSDVLKSIVVFDEHTVDSLSRTEMVHDFPNGLGRLVTHARGIDYTIVNGEVLYEPGRRHSGALPGRVLRPARS